MPVAPQSKPADSGPASPPAPHPQAQSAGQVHGPANGKATPISDPAVPKGPNLALWQKLTMPVVRLYARWQMPSAGWVLHYWGMNRAQDWTHAPTVVIRERTHGHRIRLRLNDFFQRCAYFMGSYHEQDVLTVLKHGLREGDAFLDGGANIGLITLFAAGLVGKQGRVDAFEPSPELTDTIRWHIGNNKLDQVTLHIKGLSDEAASFTMSIPALDNTGAGTLGKLPPRYGKNVRQIGTVHTVLGDQVLDPQDSRPLFIKLDIEGFEQKALNGLVDTITTRKPAILCEMIDEMLALNGASSMSIHDLLSSLGYKPYGLDRQGWRMRHGLWLHPLEPHHLYYDKDVLWLHEQGPHWPRYKDCIQKPGLYWKHHKLIRHGVKI